MCRALFGGKERPLSRRVWVGSEAMAVLSSWCDIVCLFCWVLVGCWCYCCRIPIFSNKNRGMAAFASLSLSFSLLHIANITKQRARCVWFLSFLSFVAQTTNDLQSPTRKSKTAHSGRVMMAALMRHNHRALHHSTGDTAFVSVELASSPPEYVPSIYSVM